MFSAWRRTSSPDGWETVWRVDNAGNVYGDGTVGAGPADLAEWFDTDATDLPYGTVVVLSDDAKAVASSSIADPRVMGVVAKKAAFTMGKSKEEEAVQVLVTLCGRTPVNCTTAGGEIAVGDRLVTSSDGCAQKAGGAPEPGTIIGKAMSSLETGTGLVLVLVNLQ